MYDENTIENQINSHTKNASIDDDAIGYIQYILKSNGQINLSLTRRDTWPNIDGRFELVENPKISRNPSQNFFVQVKGTVSFNINKDNTISYHLNDLAFPAWIQKEVTRDPGIIFIVFNADKRGEEKLYWKYLSSEVLSKIDYAKNSYTLKFEDSDEIKNNDESINEFIKKLINISNNYSFISKLDTSIFCEKDLLKIISFRNNNIIEKIKNANLINDKRDILSQKLLTELEDLCKSVLLINAINLKYENPSLKLAYELALNNTDTIFLSRFYESLKYINSRIPDEGQSERLMLKYYHYLWQIREYLSKNNQIKILDNLEDFPLNLDTEDKEYYYEISKAFQNSENQSGAFYKNRYYIHKKTPFFQNGKRYFEYILQLTGEHSSKFNRLTVYSKINITSSYPIRIAYYETDIIIWNSKNRIRIVTDWEVSIPPSTLNKFCSIFNKKGNINSKYKEYIYLMKFLTKTGLNFLNLIDLSDTFFNLYTNEIYRNIQESNLKDILVYMHEIFNINNSNQINGKNTIRHLLPRLNELHIDNIRATPIDHKMTQTNLNIKKACFSFDTNPILYNLPNSKNSSDFHNNIIKSIGIKRAKILYPYIFLKYKIESTGEIYINKKEVLKYLTEEQIIDYNKSLSQYDINQKKLIKQIDNYFYIEEYEYTTIYILKKLISYTREGNKGQENINKQFLNKNSLTEDKIKIKTLENIFTNSQLAIIYGAAGTGKTTLMNYISTLFNKRKKLFITNTNSSLSNLKQRIESVSAESNFLTLKKATSNKSDIDYEIIFLDECSTIDNRKMKLLIDKLPDNQLLVFSGDIYQIESIEFGNWFYYAKEIISENSISELTSTWRTKNNKLILLWDEVRKNGNLITEKLSFNGAYSKNIDEYNFKSYKYNENKIILCLNYDGKYGVNNINNFFQNANPSTTIYEWNEWKYKVGDPVLFDDSATFPILHNNLKGQITDINLTINSITFTLLIDIVITQRDAEENGFTYVENSENNTKIKLTFYKEENDEKDLTRKSIVPFQIAYAVTIHKSQGLEYDNVDIIIPSNNKELITHGIFYTAITRAKKNLKIYWSPETMKDILKNFKKDNNHLINIRFIKDKLKASS